MSSSSGIGDAKDHRTRLRPDKDLRAPGWAYNCEYLCSWERRMAASITGHSLHASSGYQLPDPEITSPNSFQVAPSNFSSCICLMGAKSVGVVESVMPGSNIGSVML
jgi:hypothetical protein